MLETIYMSQYGDWPVQLLALTRSWFDFKYRAFLSVMNVTVEHRWLFGDRIASVLRSCLHYLSKLAFSELLFEEEPFPLQLRKGRALRGRGREGRNRVRVVPAYTLQADDVCFCIMRHIGPAPCGFSIMSSQERRRGSGVWGRSFLNRQRFIVHI